MSFLSFIFSYTTFTNLYSTEKPNRENFNSTRRHPCSLWCTTILPISFCCLEETTTGMCPIIFIFWLVFFEWTETEYSNHCAGLLTLPCIQVLHHWCTYNSYNENNSWFNRWFYFYKSEEPPLLSMQKGRKQAFFILYARRYSSIWISNVIFRVAIECWHIQIAAGYLSMSLHKFVYTIKIFYHCEFLTSNTYMNA